LHDKQVDEVGKEPDPKTGEYVIRIAVKRAFLLVGKALGFLPGYFLFPDLFQAFFMRSGLLFHHHSPP
jgi:hypothetical protein